MDKKYVRNKILLGVTLIWGLAAAVIGCRLYDQYNDKLAMPLLIAGLVGGFTLVLSLLVFVTSLLTGTFSDTLPVRKGNSWNPLRIFLIILAGSVLITGLAGVFEWLYELNPEKKVQNPTSYIFILDNSGSMNSTDPGYQRVDGTNALLKECREQNLPYAVYIYSNDLNQILPMELPAAGKNTSAAGKNTAAAGESTSAAENTPAAGESASADENTPAAEEAAESIQIPYPWGGTCTKGALQGVLNDYDERWGESPKVILMSDGKAGDYDLNLEIMNLLQQYNEKNITISTVGLSTGRRDKAGRALHYIANKTGGVYVQAKDAADLAQALKDAASGYGRRNLMSPMGDTAAPLLYFSMRLLFLFALSAVTGLLQIVAAGDVKSAEMQKNKAVYAALAGMAGIIVTSELMLSYVPSLYVYFILTAATFCLRPVGSRRWILFYALKEFLERLTGGIRRRIANLFARSRFSLAGSGIVSNHTAMKKNGCCAMTKHRPRIRR